MPQKLNKAGKMQDYIPAGNGDPSGEYGTSKGTNKNFTTSDKKKTEANVIAENKSVVAGDNKKAYKGYEDIDTSKMKDSDYPKGTTKEYTEKVNKAYEEAKPILEKMGIKIEDIKVRNSKEGGMEDNTKELADKLIFNPFREKYPYGNNEAWKKEGWQEKYEAIESLEDKLYNDWWIKTNGGKNKQAYDNKANIIDNDLSGKKERAYDGSEYKSMTKEETQSIIDKLEKAGFKKDTSYSGGRTYKIYDKETGNWNSISFSEDGKLFGTTINKGVYGYADLDTAIDRATYKSGKAPSNNAIGWETGTYDSKVYDAYSRKHTKYDD